MFKAPQQALPFSVRSYSVLLYLPKQRICISAHVLLNLLSELGKRDKMRGLSSILILFRNAFNEFNSTRARMLDSIYHVILRIILA